MDQISGSRNFIQNISQSKHSLELGNGKGDVCKIRINTIPANRL